MENNLIVKFEGRVVESNLTETANKVMGQLKEMKTDLKTQEDFDQAGKVVKILKAFEVDVLKQKEEALKSLGEVFNEIEKFDQVHKASREKRTLLNKKVEERKQYLKQMIIDDSRNVFSGKVEGYRKKYGVTKHPAMPNFEGEIKGMSNLEEISNKSQRKVEEESEKFHMECQAIQVKVEVIKQSGREDLFPNPQELAEKFELEELKSYLQDRIRVSNETIARKNEEEARKREFNKKIELEKEKRQEEGQAGMYHGEMRKLEVESTAPGGIDRLEGNENPFTVGVGQVEEIKAIFPSTGETSKKTEEVNPTRELSKEIYTFMIQFPATPTTYDGYIDAVKGVLPEGSRVEAMAYHKGFEA